MVSRQQKKGLEKDIIFKHTTPKDIITEIFLFSRVIHFSVGGVLVGY